MSVFLSLSTLFYHNLMFTSLAKLARLTCQQTPGIILLLPTEPRGARCARSRRVLYVDCPCTTWSASCFRSHTAGMLYSTGLYIPYWNGEDWEKPILRSVYILLVGFVLHGKDISSTGKNGPLGQSVVRHHFFFFFYCYCFEIGSCYGAPSWPSIVIVLSSNSGHASPCPARGLNFLYSISQ